MCVCVCVRGWQGLGWLSVWLLAHHPQSGSRLLPYRLLPLLGSRPPSQRNVRRTPHIHQKIQPLGFLPHRLGDDGKRLLRHYRFITETHTHTPTRPCLVDVSFFYLMADHARTKSHFPLDFGTKSGLLPRVRGPLVRLQVDHHHHD